MVFMVHGACIRTTGAVEELLGGQPNKEGKEAINPPQCKPESPSPWRRRPIAAGLIPTTDGSGNTVHMTILHSGGCGRQHRRTILA